MIFYTFYKSTFLRKILCRPYNKNVWTSLTKSNRAAGSYIICFSHWICKDVFLKNLWNGYQNTCKNMKKQDKIFVGTLTYSKYSLERPWNGLTKPEITSLKSEQRINLLNSLKLKRLEYVSLIFGQLTIEYNIPSLKSKRNNALY